MTLTTEIVVLRKTPWQESSLIVVGLSAALGRVDLMMRGGKRLGAKAFPMVDLFRVLDIEFRDGDAGLRPLLRADLVRDHQGIAGHPERYLEACRLAAFLLRHAQPRLPAPRLYRSVLHALAEMASAPKEAPMAGPGWFDLVRLVFLAEHGLLEGDDDPAAAPGPERRRRRLLDDLLAVAESAAPMPAAPPAYWPHFHRWLDAVCQHHGLPS